MANFVNKKDVHNGAEVANWISQIHAGNETYDIATHHSITFKEGTEQTTWNGLSDLTVVIPTIQDIVQTPIEFAGTVGADGKVKWNTEHEDGPKTGYLVYITADCTFDGQACEAGDMAIYAGDAEGEGWKIVSGENQVQLVGTTDENNKLTIAVGSAQDVLTVEGKTLALVLDYADLNKHIGKEIGTTENVIFGSGENAPKVKETYIKLEQEEGQPTTIGSKVEFENATALSDGTVIFNTDTIVTGVTFGTFNQGSFPVYQENSQKDFSVTGGSLTPTDGSDFVKTVSLSSVTFAPADATDENKITSLTGISAIAGTQSFLTDIHITDEKSETANLTIEGHFAPIVSNVTFVEGLADNKTSVITDIVAGDFQLVDGDALVTGLEGGVTGVVTAVSVTANNDTDVFSSASVVDHVLTFGTTKVTSGVTATPTITNFTKKGFEYTKTTATSTSFVKSGFTKTSDVKYTFGQANETVYNTDSTSWKIITPELSITKGQYELDRNNMKVTVDGGLFLTPGVQTAGVLPTLTESTYTSSTLTGSVATALSTSKVEINGLIDNSITLPGTYTLVTATSSTDAVAVGAAGVLDNMSATIDLSGYLKDVTVESTVVKTE